MTAVGLLGCGATIGRVASPNGTTTSTGSRTPATLNAKSSAHGSRPGSKPLVDPRRAVRGAIGRGPPRERARPDVARAGQRARRLIDDLAHRHERAPAQGRAAMMSPTSSCLRSILLGRPCSPRGSTTSSFAGRCAAAATAGRLVRRGHRRDARRRRRGRALPPPGAARDEGYRPRSGTVDGQPEYTLTRARSARCSRRSAAGSTSPTPASSR